MPVFKPAVNAILHDFSVVRYAEISNILFNHLSSKFMYMANDHETRNQIIIELKKLN